jgi:2'-5' RNA ligase
MQKQISAYQFKSVYEDLGYDIGKLGCIMLDIDPEDLGRRVSEVIAPEEIFQSDDPADHINGIEAGNPHVTLLYGLLRSGPEMKKHVLEVLDDGRSCPQTVQIDRIDYFESPKPDKPYYCIVAHLVITPELQECNDRLKFLPHLNTFSGYKAHMTLAYIKEDSQVRDRVVAQLNGLLRGRLLPTTGLNFGD